MGIFHLPVSWNKYELWLSVSFGFALVIQNQSELGSLLINPQSYEDLVCCADGDLLVMWREGGQ